MKRISRTYTTALNRALSTLLVMSLLVGGTPRAWAAQAVEPSAGNVSVEVSDSEGLSLSDESTPTEGNGAHEDLEDTSGGDSLVDTPIILSSTEVAYPVEGGNLYFNTASGTIVDCDTSVTNVSIPTVIEGIKVTQIGDSAFRACGKMTNVNIPTSVTSIGDGAFNGCSELTSINIPASVINLGRSAFANCRQIMSISIPDSVTNIGEDIFSDCSQLKTVTLPENILEIPAGMFWRCSNLNDILIPENVKRIGDDAFYGCKNLISLTIPSSVIQIDRGAFSGCEKLDNVIIPSGITEISDNTFEYCDGLTSIALPDTIKRIGIEAFHHCDNLTDVILPDNVRDIGASAFERCVNLIHIKLPSNLERIGEFAFHECEKLSTVILPEGLHYIGERAFWKCDSLKNVAIPASVSSIGEGALNECSNLESVEVDGRNSYYASLDGVLFNKAMDYLIKFPDAKGGSYVIPASVRNIGESSFYECRKITSVTVPVGVTSIEASTFSYCENLSSINLPAGLISIGGTAFDYCKSLVSITIPDSVISIGDSAFRECISLKSVIFQGDAPSLKPATFPYSRSFPEGTTLYYLSDKSGWTTPTWNGGYNTLPVIGLEEAIETHTDNYYTKLSDYYFHFIDRMAGDLVGVSLEFGGQTISSDSESELAVAFAGTDPEQVVTIGKPGYYSAHIPLFVLGAYNYIGLYPETYKKPFAQAVYASQNDGKTYHDLLSTGMSFYAGSLDELTSFYIDINWGNQGNGRIYLSQTLNPEDGIELDDGLNDAMNVSMHLESGHGLYLLMVTESGETFAKSLVVNIISEDTEFDVDFGDSVDIAVPSDDGFFSKFKMGFNLLKKLDVSLSIENDGTVVGTLGVKVAEKKDVGPAVKTIKDALYYADNYPKDWNSFVQALNGGSIIPQSCTFGITLNAKAIGYLEGKLVQEEDGSYRIQFIEGKIAAKFEGKYERTWQIYSLSGIPFYVGGSIEPSIEISTPILPGNSLFPIAILSSDVKGNIPLKLRGGLGWDSIASAGIYGKGTLTAELPIPIVLDQLKLYANATFGAEAKFFCFKADLEIYNTKDFYLYGSPDANTALIQPFSLNTASADWQPQSRDYLYGTALMEVGEDDVQTDAQTVASGVYSYADVQMAVLPDGTQLMVWTADPGEVIRPEANNRTVLYYAVNTGSGWNVPAPVEIVDDDTADFNPLLTVLDGTAYLLWQDASRPLTNNDDVSTTAQVMNISVAAFDAAGGTFTSLGSVGTEFYDGAVSAGLTDGQLTVVWASNSGNNPLVANGQVGALHRAVWDGGQFVTETLEENFGAIDQTATDGTSIWFSADTDYDSGTLNDREIFCYHNDLSQCTDNDVADTKPSFRNGSLLWYSGGAIVTENGEAIPLAEDTDRYDYVQNSGGMEAVVYTVTDEPRVSALYASFNDGTGWGEPILLNSASGNVGSFSAQFCPDGTLSISTSERATSEVTGEYEVPKLSSTAQIKVYSVTPVCDLAVSDVTYLPQSLVSGGTLDIQLELENKGMTAVPMATVQVMNGSEILAEQTYSMDLRSGECIGLMVNVPLEIVPEQLQVAVTPIGYSDDNEADNSADLSLRLSDISLEGGTGYSDGNTTTVTVLVVNRGQTVLNDIVLNLYDDNDALLSAQTVSALTIGDAEFVTFALDHPMANNSILRVEAEEVDLENILGNNSSVLLVSASPGKALTLMASAMDTDSSLAVVATVRNATDADQAYSLICASYDKDGRLLHTAVLNDLSTQSGAEDYHQLTLASNDFAKTVKVFLLSSDHVPLTQYVELQLE